MVKVSFIAIFLAAIGYKEYNPSVVGKWENKKTKNEEVVFNEKGECIVTYSHKKGSIPNYYPYTTLYSIKGEILKVSFDRISERVYIIKRQNKRKLIFQPRDLEEAKKLKFKRLE